MDLFTTSDTFVYLSTYLPTHSSKKVTLLIYNIPHPASRITHHLSSPLLSAIFLHAPKNDTSHVKILSPPYPRSDHDDNDHPSIQLFSFSFAFSYSSSELALPYTHIRIMIVQRKELRSRAPTRKPT